MLSTCAWQCASFPYLGCMLTTLSSSTYCPSVCMDPVQSNPLDLLAWVENTLLQFLTPRPSVDQGGALPEVLQGELVRWHRNHCERRHGHHYSLPLRCSHSVKTRWHLSGFLFYLKNYFWTSCFSCWRCLPSAGFQQTLHVFIGPDQACFLFINTISAYPSRFTLIIYLF